jgi:hypothetical protein
MLSVTNSKWRGRHYLIGACLVTGTYCSRVTMWCVCSHLYNVIYGNYGIISLSQVSVFFIRA